MNVMGVCFNFYMKVVFQQDDINEFCSGFCFFKIGICLWKVNFGDMFDLWFNVFMGFGKVWCRVLLFKLL